MKEKKEKAEEGKVETKEPKTKKKVSKTLEAARKLKGSLIVNDPKFLL